VRSGRRHPFLGMRSIAHSCAYRDALELSREDIEHRLPRRTPSCRADRPAHRPFRHHTHMSALGLRYLGPVQRRHSRRRKIVESRVDVPTVEPCDAFCLVLGRDRCLVECSVGMFERCGRETLMIVPCCVAADELYLRHARDKCVGNVMGVGVSAYMIAADGRGGCPCGRVNEGCTVPCQLKRIAALVRE
jgi:hypothetical protein